MNTNDSKPKPSFLETVRKYYQSRHAPAVARLEDNEGAQLTTTIVATISVLIILFIIWISITPVEEIAITFGEVIPKSNVYSIQHLEGGMIKTILVKEGDEVRAGQTLVEFDPTIPQLELQQIRARNAALIASAENLKQFLETEHPDKFSSEQAVEPDIKSSTAQQDNTSSIPSVISSGIKPTNQNAGKEQTTAFKEQAAEDVARFDSILVILKRRLAILIQEKDMYESLLKTGSVSKKDYLALLRTVTQVQEDISKTQAAHVETLYLIGKLENRINNIEVKAPIHGLVKGLQIHAGNIIQPGGILMDVVPVEDLIIEAKIHATDIGHISIGDPVKIKITTYDYTRFGIITGKLIKLSATTFLDEKGVPFYKGLIELEKSYVGQDSSQNRLLPGMTVQADINTGSKTLLEYLLRPIQVAISSSFREY
jgi:adhesin transport system membrane fusion protein